MNRYLPKTIQFTIVSLLFTFVHSCTPTNITPTPPVDPIDIVDTTMLNIAYGTDPKQKLDLYLPANRSDTTKIIVLIHGGGWYEGDKSEMNVLIPKIKAAWPDVAIANINYRLANGTSILHTQIMNDIDSAIHYIANNTTLYTISDDMGIIGASAGGHLGLLYTYLHNDENRIKCVANLFAPSHFRDWDWYNSYNIFFGKYVKDIQKNYTGTYWDEPLYASLSPYHIVTVGNYRPTISFHGNLDMVVPIYQNQWFNNKLNTLGLTNEYYEYVDGHGFNSANYTDCINKTVTFFKAHF